MDLLSKLHAQITFFPKEQELDLQIPPGHAQQFLMQPRERGKQLWLEEIENQVNPIVWAAGRPGRAKRASPVKADLKPGAGTPGRRQYPCERTP